MMPKYSYFCKECEYSFVAFHEIKTLLKKCPQCDVNDALVREINKIFIKKQKTDNSNKKIGELTNQFIEDNREVLKEYKEELENNEFDNKNIDN